jgi:PAS domain S-box-containing protein
MRMPPATRIINLIQSDIGRPLAHIVTNLDNVDLVQEAKDVLDKLNTKEVEMQSNEGRWYSTRILPYRTTENVIEGIVLTFVDITQQKKVQRELEERQSLIAESNEYARSIIDTVREPLLVLDNHLRIVSANRSFYKNFQVEKEQTEGQFLYELGNEQWDIPKLRELLEEILPDNSTFDDFEVEHEFPNIGRRKMLLNARRIERKEDEKALILLAIEDVTEK